MTWSERLTVDDGERVTKRYRLTTEDDAERLAADTRRYADRLADRLPVVEPIRVEPDDETVVVVQPADRGPTLHRELRVAIEGSLTDREVAQLVVTRFEDVADLLTSVSVVSESAYDILDRRRYEVGVYLQPTGLFTGDGVAVAKLLPPLGLNESGVLDFDAVPPDVRLPPKLSYYLRFTPVGVLQNLGVSLLSVVATDLPQSLFRSTRDRLVSLAADRLRRVGYDGRLAGLIDTTGYTETFRPVERTLHQSDTGVDAFLELAEGER